MRQVSLLKKVKRSDHLILCMVLVAIIVETETDEVLDVAKCLLSCGLCSSLTVIILSFSFILCTGMNQKTRGLASVFHYISEKSELSTKFMSKLWLYYGVRLYINFLKQLCFFFLPLYYFWFFSFRRAGEGNLNDIDI